ncbi:MAG: efflux RND transporter periplasmic adaptor subunit [Holosporales bacterium]|jgi:HlyD family secretion protein|nr:efflux RND transporter periplasmic adaptor subunit [Holosporales bacterium]
MNIKKIFIASIGIGAVAFGAWYTKPWEMLGGFNDELFYAGCLEATRVVIPSRLPSQIIKFDIKAGDRLKKGDLLAELDSAELQISLKKIKSKHERALTLYKAGNFSKSDLEAIQAEKDGVELKLRWCKVASSIDGVILAKYKELGEWVTQGTGLALIADIRNIKAFFYVEHDKVASLKVGADVVCSLPEVPGREFHGKIAVISSEPEFTPKNVQTRSERTRLVYKVQVDFLNEDEVLKPGMTIETLFKDAP